MQIVVLTFELMVEAVYQPEITSHELYIGKNPGLCFVAFSGVTGFECMKM